MQEVQRSTAIATEVEDPAAAPCITDGFGFFQGVLVNVKLLSGGAESCCFICCDHHRQLCIDSARDTDVALLRPNTLQISYLEVNDSFISLEIQYVYVQKRLPVDVLIPSSAYVSVMDVIICKTWPELLH